MDWVLAILVPFAVYGVYAAVRDYDRARQDDASRFRQQIARFEALYPDVSVSHSTPPARYYVVYRCPDGLTVLEFERTRRRAARRQRELLAQGLSPRLDFLPDNLELGYPWP
jgi:hypothetical protein